MTFRDADKYLAPRRSVLSSVLAVAVHARLHIIRGNTGHAPPRSRALSPTRILCSCRERSFLSLSSVLAINKDARYELVCMVTLYRCLAGSLTNANGNFLVAALEIRTFFFSAQPETFQFLISQRLFITS